MANLHQDIILFLEIYSMTILVTGGNGFLGKKLINILEKNNIRAKVIIRSSLVNDLKNFSNITFMQKDLCKNEIKDEDLIDIDTVVHLAGKTNNGSANNEALFKDNELSTFYLTNSLLKNKKVKKFIYASSQYVYGNPSKFNIDENTPLAPNFCTYSTSKCNAENFIRLLQMICLPNWSRFYIIFLQFRN